MRQSIPNLTNGLDLGSPSWQRCGMTDMPAQDTKKIEQAIDALLRALIERPSPEQRAEHVVTPGDNEDSDVDEEVLDAIIADPIGSACRSEIASLGAFLFDILGSIDEVTSVADRISASDSANKARRSAILDECWEDLGLEDEADE